MKKLLLALLVLTALLCLAAYGFLHQAEQRMERAVLDGLPHLFSRQGRPASVAGQVEASLLAGRISLRDLDIRQPGDGLRLQVSELSVSLDTEHLHAILQTLEHGHNVPPGEDRGPLVLDDVNLRGARLQTADGAWSAQRQHIAHLEISSSLLWALDRGTATLASFRKGVSFSRYSADFCDYDAPSLLAPLRLSIRELSADALADGKLLRLNGREITLDSAPYMVECRVLRHAALPLADMLAAPDMLASLTHSLTPASVAARNQPAGSRGDNGWSLADVRCRLADAPLFAIERLSWEKDVDLDGRDSHRRLEGGRLYADALAGALGLALPAGAVWQWEMDAQSHVTDDGTEERLTWRSSLADGSLSAVIPAGNAGVRQLNVRYADKGLLALVGLNRPDALRDPLRPLEAYLPAPLPHPLREALLRLWRQPGTLDVRLPDGVLWDPFTPPAAGEEPPLIITVEPGAETLRAQIDRLKKKQR
ncbi:hypothetical protein [uncultured Desulfovibrio sp.]|uniref:hypothetical protein n=1 Tax=uncultured Desulfovibrio sp. TaxID=167968 RepID=UPI0025F10258|nr:hypothetical protein [uncultured Desulfovibrio sp.]